MNIQLNIKRKSFLPVYLPYVRDYKNRYEVYYGGAGSGKSVFIAQKLLIKACSSKRKILVIRKYGTSVRDSVYQLIIDMLKKWGLYNYCKINQSIFMITLPNGSVFLFKGLDDSEKIKSITDITDIWCEEATELSEEEFTQLDLRLRARIENLQIFVSFNPVSKANWVYNRWFSDKKVCDNTLIIHTTYKDNHFLPKEYIDSLENTIKTNPTYYKIYVLGEFCSLEKLVYNNWKVEEFNHVDIKGQLLVGLDFGFVNDTAALIASILDEEHKRIYIFKEWGDTNKTNPELARIIKSLGFSKSVIIADSAEPKSIVEIKREGIPKIKESVKGKDSVIHGIQKLQQYELIVHPDCTETITEFENYSWKKDKKTGEYTNEPVDSFNHFLDALRYSIQSADKGKLKTMNKSKLGL